MRLLEIKIPDDSPVFYVFGKSEMGYTNLSINNMNAQEGVGSSDEFWHKNIDSITAIVGENGVGKTTILKSIMNYSSFVVEDEKGIREEKTYNGRIIYYSPHYSYDAGEYSEDRLYNISKYNQIKEDAGIDVDLDSALLIHESKCIKRLIKLLRSEIQDVIKSKTELTIFSKITIKANYFDFNNHDTPYTFRDFFEYLERMRGELIKGQKQKNINDDISLNENKLRNYKMHLELNLIDAIIKKVHYILERSGNKYLMEGYMVDDLKVDNDEFVSIDNLKEAFYFFLERAYVLPKPKRYLDIQKTQEVKIYLPVKEIKVLVDLLIINIHNIDNIKDDSTEIDVGLDQAAEIIEAYEKMQVAFRDYFTFNDSPALLFFPNKKLSSGERALYDLFGTLYDVKFRIDNRVDNKFYWNDNVHYANYLLLFDEADLGFHPMWKKKFIDMLVNIIPEIFKDKNINIVFSTHDPLTLSDIPKQNVIYLTKQNGVTKILDDKSKIQTFGANIHDLLSNSFFIQDGLIGDFAKRKINEVVSWVVNNEYEDQESPIFRQELNKKRYIIEQIDEIILKRKLGEMIDELVDDHEFYEKILLEEIKNLQNKLSEL